MPHPTELLDPLSGPNPAGADLRYEAIYDEIKEARREDPDLPQGEWETTRKRADWPLVIKLATDALATQTKDLQIAAWLAEALLHREGYGGFRDGLDLMRSFIERFWEHVYPVIQDGDTEFRSAPLEWVGQYLVTDVKSVPLDGSGHSFLDYKASRAIPTKEEAEADAGKQEARERALAAGKLPPEQWDEAFAATPKEWYRELVADIDGALASLEALDQLGVEKFGDLAPSYLDLRKALEEVRHTAGRLLDRKLAANPDSGGETPAAATDRQEMAANVTADAADAGPAPPYAAEDPMARPAKPAVPEAGAGAGGGGPPRSTEDAAARLAAAARYLRGTAPADPASYLMLRGFRWGELRAGRGTLDPRLLAAPPTETRTRLKTLLLDGRWAELLDAGEEVMATPYGRGWLDLQRYALTACDGLGGEYDRLAAAVQGALLFLLADLPHLVDMTLMDDSPTANPETRAWLKERGIVTDPTDSDGPAAAIAARTNGRRRSGRDPFEEASEHVRAGQAERAIELLMHEAVREKSPRARFLRRSQAASIMVQSNLAAVALPILQELHEQIEQHGLENWEDGATIAQPLGLLYRCLEGLDGDAAQRESLYQRICRLDPLLAIELGSTVGNDAEVT